MKRLSISTFAAATLFLGACQTDGPVTPGMIDGGEVDVLQDYAIASVKRTIPTGCANAGQPATTAADAAFGGLCQGIDVLGNLTLRASPVTTLSYAENPNFDKALHQSLKAKHDTVTVNIEGTGLTRETLAVETLGYQNTHMTAWLAKLQGNGGTVISCAQRTEESMFLLNWILGVAIRMADEWVTYRPLSAYDEAVIMYEMRGDQRVASTVTFHKIDDTPAACPAGSSRIDGQT